MVIHQINVESVTLSKAEDDAIVSRYRHAPEALEITLQGVEPIARQIQFGGLGRLIKMREYIGNPVDLIGSKSANISMLIEALQTPVSQRPDHVKLYRVSVRVSTETNWV